MTLPAEQGRGSAPSRRERLLIIDDNQINRQVLMGILRKEGYDLLQAGNGFEALEIAQRVRPELVLLDIMMPGMDGFEVCRRLKQDPAMQDVPVIFLSALSEAANKVKGLELGAVDYITKPFDQAEVLARVRTHLNIRRLTVDLRRANQELTEKQARLDQDLDAARKIQELLIPRQPLDDDKVAVRWLFRPCGAIGGDMCRYYAHGRHLLSYVFDVCGHGVPAAMLTVLVTQMLSPYSGYGCTAERARDGDTLAVVRPKDVLVRLEKAYPIGLSEKHFTISYLLTDLETGELLYSRAGHPPPILVRRDGDVQFLEEGGTIIGYDLAVPFEEGGVTLHGGDRVYIYSDGIPEHRNRAGTEYGVGRLVDELRAVRTEGLDAVCQRVMASVEAFGGGEPFEDDLTFMAIEFRGGARAG